MKELIVNTIHNLPRTMNKPFVIILSFAAAGLFGLLTIFKMPYRTKIRQIERAITVSYTWANASPEEVDLKVTTPLEGAFAAIQGVHTIKSESGYGRGQIILRTDDGVKESHIRFEVSSKIRRMYRFLPMGLSYPEVSIAGTEAVHSKPWLSLQLSGNISPGQLRKYFERYIESRLIQIDGVKSVKVRGGSRDEIRIVYRSKALGTVGIDRSGLVNSLQQNYHTSQLGSISNADGSKYSVSLVSRTTLPELRKLPITKRSGRVFDLLDIAKTDTIEKSPNSIFRVNGEAAVQADIFIKDDLLQTSTTTDIVQLVNSLNSTLPNNIRITIHEDLTRHMNEQFNTFLSHLAVTLLLVAAISLIYLRNLVSTLAVLFSLLEVTSVAFAILFFSGTSLSLPTLPSIPISCGIAGAQILFAISYYKSGKAISSPLIAGTVISCVCLLITSGFPSDQYMSLVDFVSITTAMQISTCVVCLLLVPFITKQTITTPAPSSSSVPPSLFSQVSKLHCRIIQFLSQRKVAIACGAVLFFGLPIFQIPQKIDGNDRISRLYNYMFDNNVYQESIRPILNILTGGTLRLFYNEIYDAAFVSSDEETVLYVHAGLPNHSSLDQMDEVVKKIEQHLSAFSDVDRYQTSITSGQFASLIIYFKPNCSKGYPFRLKTSIIGVCSEMGGVDWDVFGFGNGFNSYSNQTSISSFNVVLRGYDYRELGKVTNEFADRLRRNPRIIKVDANRVPGQTSQKDLSLFKMQLSSQYLQKKNISPIDVSKRVEENGLRPLPSAHIFLDDVQLEVQLKTNDHSNYDIRAIESEPMFFSDTSIVKLADLSRIVKESMVPTIKRENQEYLRQISFDYLGSTRLGEQHLLKEIEEYRKALPIGFNVDMKQPGNFDTVTRNQWYSVLVSAFFIFVIATIMFESIKMGLLLTSSTIMCFVGTFLMFAMSSSELDQGGLVSISFVQIMIPLPLLCVMQVTYLKKGKLGLAKETEEVSSLLLRVIPIYVICASSGLLYFAIYETSISFWSSFSVGTLGGILAVLFVAIFLTPSLATPQIK